MGINALNEPIERICVLAIPSCRFMLVDTLTKIHRDLTLVTDIIVFLIILKGVRMCLVRN